MTIDFALLHEYKPKGYPVRHRRKETFQPNVDVEFMKRASRIRELDHELDGYILTGKDYYELIVEAYASNVHWSTKLEGNPLPEAAVKRLTHATFSGQNIERPAGPRQEIINHLYTMLYPSEWDLPWSHEKIQTLNNMLLMDTGANCTIGRYREKDAWIKTDENQEVFIPAPYIFIEKEMGFLLDWVNKYATAYNPVVAATVLFHEFESIHPFEDGNGRTGRSLFHIFLQRNGLSNSHLCKIESHILRDSELYYQLLAYTDETNDYSRLIEYNSYCILESYKEAYENLRHKDLLSSDLDELSKKLLRKAKNSMNWFSVQDALKWTDNISNQTVRNRLNVLVTKGVLEKSGATKSCRYRFIDPLRTIRENAMDIVKTSSQVSASS